MDILIVLLVAVVLLVNIALFLKFKKEPEKDNKEDDVAKIKTDIASLKSSLNDSFSSMSKEVAKDMTGALSRVDEKVASFNKQVEDIQSSQNNFSRILVYNFLNKGNINFNGEVAEWSKAPVLKTGERASVPWVRIPPSPPFLILLPIHLLT